MHCTGCVVSRAYYYYYNAMLHSMNGICILHGWAFCSCRFKGHSHGEVFHWLYFYLNLFFFFDISQSCFEAQLIYSSILAYIKYSTSVFMILFTFLRASLDIELPLHSFVIQFFTIIQQCNNKSYTTIASRFMCNTTAIVFGRASDLMRARTCFAPSSLTSPRIICVHIVRVHYITIVMNNPKSHAWTLTFQQWEILPFSLWMLIIRSRLVPADRIWSTHNRTLLGFTKIA